MTHQPRQWSDSEKSAGQKFADTWKTYAEQQGGEAAKPSFETLAGAARVAEVQDRHETELLGLENVVGVATSKKMKGGKLLKKDTLLVLVERKEKADKLSKSEVVPAEIDGVETDVVEVGPIEALAFDARVRPALPGFSIGHYNITAGTFGALVRDVRRCCCKIEKDCCCDQLECDGDILILSNNHVLADVNEARPGDKILQPGPFDGGLFPSDMVATFERTEEIVFGASGYNLVDAAVARPTDARNVTASIIGLVAPTGVGQATPLMNVVKAGRTTEITTGVVLSTNAVVSVNYAPLGAPPLIGVFRHQIITTQMGAPGDSGSLLMDFDLAGVGLLYAGSPVITIHNHLLDVQNALGVELVTTG